MRLLRTNTAARVTVGPFYDKTDGVTPETSLTVTSCKLTLMVDDANVPTLALDASATASGGSNDMVHVTGDDAGFYDLELTAANVNYLGRAMLAITDAATHCPVFHEFMILPAMIYDSLVLGTDRLDTNVTHIADQSQTARDIGASVLLSAGTGTGQLDFTSGVVKSDAVQLSGDSTAADNAELFFDGTGYNGANNIIGRTNYVTNAVSPTGRIIYIDYDESAGGDGSREAPYESWVTALVAGVNEGDTLHFLPSTCNEAITNLPAGVTIEGDGDASIFSAGIAVSDDMTIRNIKVNVTGTGSGTNAGITGSTKKGVRIINCNIFGYYDGIQLGNCLAPIVERCIVSSEYDAINVADCHNWVIKDSFLTTTGTWNSGGADSRGLLYGTAGGKPGGGTVQNCIIKAKRTTGSTFPTMAIGASQSGGGSAADFDSHLSVVNCTLIAQNTSGTGLVAGIGSSSVNAGRLLAAIENTKITTVNNGSGGEYHIDANVSGSKVRVSNTQYDPAKLNGAANIITDLSPTTAGRTLDVSSTGEAGLDWNNIGTPSATQNLSATTIKTATDVETDTTQLLIDVGLLATNVDDVATDVDAVLVDTNELQTDWVNGGRLDLIVDAILADTNELQTDWADGGRLDLLLDGAASAGDPWTTTLPGAYTGSQAGKMLSDMFGVVDTEVGDIRTRVLLALPAAAPNANGGLPILSSSGTTLGYTVTTVTTLGWQASWDAEVESEVTDALNAYDPPTRTEATSDTNSVLTAVADVPTNAELTAALAAADDAVLAAIAALNNLSSAQVQTAVTSAIAALTADGYTPQQCLRIIMAALGGKVSGGATSTNTFRAADDSKTRITATVDADGNRSAVTLDAT